MGVVDLDKKVQGKQISRINSTWLIRHWLYAGEVEHFLSPFEGSEVTAQSISISFYQGLFAYNGWWVYSRMLVSLLLYTAQFSLYFVWVTV